MTMNPQGGLASLVAALQGGMDPNQAFGIVQFLEAEQQERMANRTQRLGGLASLLTDAAASGMPYQATDALLEAQPGPAGPAVQSMLSSLYPTAQEPVSAPIDTAGGRGGGYMAETKQQELGVGPYTQSPIFTQNPQTQMAMQQQELALQAQAAELAGPDPAIEQAWAGLMADLAAFKSKGIAPDVAFATVAQKNPELAAFFSSDQGRLQGIMESIFGQTAVKYAGAAPATG